MGKLGRIVAGGMLREGTPVEDYREDYSLEVKREDKACPPPGPPFSKARGVYARVASRPEEVIGVLDTRHSQAGHAVARACQVLGKKCVNYYPEFKHEPGPRDPQLRAAALGAELVGLTAGMSAVLWYQARKLCERAGGYMMPNALKLEESVMETAKEVPAGIPYDTVLIPVSSGTIAAGVIRGFGGRDNGGGYYPSPRFIIHMGYSRSHKELEDYIRETSGCPAAVITLVDEEYEYKDVASPGPTPPWPCNEHYDLKCFRWWMEQRSKWPTYGRTLMWNIG